MMIAAIIWVWAFALIVERWRGALWLGIALPAGILLNYKYKAFLLEIIHPLVEIDVGAWPAILNLALPAGISFYTFKLVAYIIDVRDGKVEKENTPILFIAFISAFPQLIAGPILRYKDMREQIHKIFRSEVNIDFKNGVKYLAFGLFYKVVLSDMLSALYRPVRINFTPTDMVNVHFADAIFYVASYSFQIYFDFWGYSLMAIGLGRMLSLKIPHNFAEPYLSRNPAEFWRRWHITLSYWIRDYVYVRIGGNKSYIRNICIVFILSGLWHGAGPRFIFWGIYHAILVIGYHLARPVFDRLPAAVAVALTFLFVSLGWPLFDLGARQYWNLLTLANGHAPLRMGWEWGYLAAVAMAVFATREARWLFNDRAMVANSPYVQAVVASVSVLLLNFSSTFIYFRF